MTAAWSTVTRCFGSWNDGLEAAGLEKNSDVGTYTPEILVAQLKAEAERLKRTPTKWDIVCSSKEGRTASDKTFIDCFGSFPEALEAAGYEVKFKPRFVEITREMLMSRLKAEAELFGRTRHAETSLDPQKKVERQAPLHSLIALALGTRHSKLRGYGTACLRTSHEK